MRSRSTRPSRLLPDATVTGRRVAPAAETTQPPSRGRLRILSLSASLLLLCGLLGAGCSNQALTRPVMGPLSDVFNAPDTKEEDRRKQEQVLERTRRLTKALAAWKADPASRLTDYCIGADDVVEIGILALDEPGRTTSLIRTVSREGNVMLPWVGDVPVLGATTREIERRIAAALKGRFLKDPQVTVVINQYRSASVVVTGAVAKPGVYYLRSNQASVLEVLAEASGLDANAGDELFIVRGGVAPAPLAAAGATDAAPSNAVPDASASAPDTVAPATNQADLVTINLKDLIDSGNLRLNLWVSKGDIITVLPRNREYIYVLGYVMRQGAIEISRVGDIDAMKALILSGGVSPIGRAENSFIIRETPTGQRIIPVDLTRVTRGGSKTEMVAGDTLVVGSSFFAKMSEFVRTGVTAGVGMTYNPLPP